jgi:S-adenosylmethionine synthetase
MRSRHEPTGAFAEVHLVSATGQRLDRPWRIVVRLADGGDELADDKLRTLLLETLESFPTLTEEILSGDGIPLA